jgi:homogentisate 1,2-dioxygenase
MKPIALPRSEGLVSRQAHADLPEGTFEREIGREGFAGPAAHMYHAHPPTGWSSFEGPLRPRAFDSARLERAGDSPWDAALLFSNAHLRYRLWIARGSMDHLVRNADGDELIFVHAGRGELFCDWGHLEIREGDYVCLPRGALWRVESAGSLRLLLIEATGGGYRLPERGLLGEHALFDPGVLDTPRLDDAFRAQQSERPWEVRVQARGRLSRIAFPFNPLDAVGWKGTLAPVRLNWRDIRPVVSPRYHLPPSVHTTFVAERFAICTFCPRPLESDPGALKLPFFHSNDDVDEVLFYHSGRFVSRDFATPGMITFHPSGFTHGPHPKAFERAARDPARETQEVAVMLDARDALEPGPDALAVEWEGYVDSWKGG